MMCAPATNSATDLVLTILPGVMFYDLKMDLKKKLGLLALLSLSVLCAHFHIETEP